MWPDLSVIAEMIRRGDIASLRRLIDSGWDLDERQYSTGSSALLWACGYDQVEIVELLLGLGADPDVWHNDGYRCYDSTGSERIKRLLLAHGYSLRSGGAGPSGRGLQGLRLLVPAAVATEEHTLALTGTDLHLEYRLLALPPTAGSLRLRRGDWSTVLTAPAHVTMAVPGDAATVTVTLTGFRGDCAVRLFCEATIAGNDGPRDFWLPDWSQPGP